MAFIVGMLLIPKFDGAQQNLKGTRSAHTAKKTHEGFHKSVNKHHPPEQCGLSRHLVGGRESDSKKNTDLTPSLRLGSDFSVQNPSTVVNDNSSQILYGTDVEDWTILPFRLQFRLSLAPSSSVLVTQRRVTDSTQRLLAVTRKRNNTERPV